MWSKKKKKKKKWPVRGLPWEYYTTLERAGVNRKWRLVWLQLSTQSVALCFLPSDFLTRWVTAARMFPRARSEMWDLLIHLTRWVKYVFRQFSVDLLYCFMLYESEISCFRNVIIEVWIGVLEQHFFLYNFRENITIICEISRQQISAVSL